LPACGAEAGSPSDTTAVQTSEKTQSVSSFTGDFTVFKADINFDPENLGASSVTVTVPLKQVDAGTGDSLMLKGKDQPLELPFSLIIESGRAVMTSNVILDRTNWSVGEDPWNTDEWVSKNVTLDILITATKS